MSLRNPGETSVFYRITLGDVVIWTFVLAVLAWLTHVCLFGMVEYRLGRNEMRGSTHVATCRIPLSLPLFTADLELEILEQGRPLGPRLEEPNDIYRRRDGAYAFEVGAWGSSTTIFFTASDGSTPRRNGRAYSIRYPRRKLPAAFVLLVSAWLFLPWLAWRASHRLHSGSGESRAVLPPVSWSILIVGCIYSLFAVQACLNVSATTPWLLAICLVALPFLLSDRDAGRWLSSPWLPWLAALWVWALASALAAEYGSFTSATAFVATSLWGMILYLALRRSLVNVGGGTWSVAWALLGFALFLSLARSSGLDPVGFLESLNLTSCKSYKLAYPWTTKFFGHWLVVAAWFGVLSLARCKQLGRSAAIFAGVLTCLAIGSNGSRSAVLAVLVSIAVGMAALHKPRWSRRIIFGFFVLHLLLAPWVASVPWNLFTSSSESSDVLPEAVTHDLGVRGGVWEFSRRWILRRPVEGWGFGAGTNLPLRGVSIADVLDLDPKVESQDPSLWRHGAYAGAHPHNLPLLIWLELGLVGALLAVGLLLAAERSLANLERNKRVHAALLGLWSSQAAFFILNYPAWHPAVASVMWISVALAGAVLKAPAVGRRSLCRAALPAFLILSIGGAELAREEISRQLTVREMRHQQIFLDSAGERLVGRRQEWDLRYDARPIGGVEWARSPGIDAKVRGWAYAPPELGNFDEVLVFVGSRLVAVVWPEKPSPEAFRQQAGGDLRSLDAGFELQVDPALIDLRSPVTLVWLRSNDALAIELPPLGAPR